MTDSNWALKLYSRSPLKQKKFAMLTKMLGECSEANYLDVGSDNGVISYLLRMRGGTWYSTDLIPETVESIRSLVKDRVIITDGKTLSFNDSFFKAVLIVDLLEHIHTDSEFIAEIYRVLQPGGTLIINVPNPKNGILRRIRFALGQTDEAHGHVRAGYSESEIKKLIGEKFEVQLTESYSRFFAELIDTIITAGIKIFKKNSATAKGSVITGNDLGKMKKMLKLYNLIYPLVWIFARLDEAIPFMRGNMLIVKAVKKI